MDQIEANYVEEKSGSKVQKRDCANIYLCNSNEKIRIFVSLFSLLCLSQVYTECGLLLQI